MLFSPISLSSVEDYKIALNLFNGKGFSLNSNLGPTAIKSPIYPFFLYSIMKITSIDSKFILVLFQILLHFIFPIFILYFTKKYLIEYYSLIYFGLLFYILNPSYIYYPLVIESTNISVPIVIFLLLIIIFKFQSKNFSFLIDITIGSLLAIVTLTQPVYIPAFFIIYFFYKKELFKFSKKTIIIIFLILLLPWTFRNLYQFDKPIISKSPFWMNFYLGYLEENNGSKELSIDSTNTPKFIEEMKNKYNDVKMEEIYKIVFLERFNSNTIDYFKKSLLQAKIYWTWVPRYNAFDNKQFLIIRVIPVIILNIVSIYCLFFLFQYNRKLFLSIFFVLLYFTIVYSLTCAANTRYKLDIEWLQFIPISVFISEKLRISKGII